MNWDKNIIQNLEWNSEISNLAAKQKIADRLAKLAKDGEVIGFGSGSTSFLAVQAIAKRIKEENLKITAIPTSKEIAMVCNFLEIPIANLVSKKPDWCFDGADEVDKNNCLIKGRGAAMFNEKLIMANAKKTYILVDESKLVNKLGEKFAIPIEVYPDAIYSVKERLIKLGAKEIDLRLAVKKDGPVITENGNFILDAKFDNINKNFEKDLKSIVGVIETGLFIGYNVEIIT